MSKTIAQAQREYRERRAARIERMTSALQRIVLRLDGNDKSLAVELRAMALWGLNGDPS